MASAGAFNGKLRDECMNRETLCLLKWKAKGEYKTSRPCSALGYWRPSAIGGCYYLVGPLSLPAIVNIISAYRA
jgi:hypothetical protein